MDIFNPQYGGGGFENLRAESIANKFMPADVTYKYQIRVI